MLGTKWTRVYFTNLIARFLMCICRIDFISLLTLFVCLFVCLLSILYNIILFTCLAVTNFSEFLLCSNLFYLAISVSFQSTFLH